MKWPHASVAVLALTMALQSAHATDAPTFIGHGNLYPGLPGVAARPHGGAFVLYQDPTAVARVAAVSPLGTLEPAWTPEGLSFGTLTQASISPDGSGGFYVAGVTRVDSWGWLKLFRFTADGSPATAWPDTGISLGAGPLADRPSLFIAGDASAFLSWHQNHLNGTSDPQGVMLTRVLPSGVPAAGWTTGGTQASADGYLPVLAGDTATASVVVAFLRDISGSSPWVFAARYLSSGARASGWVATGNLLSTNLVATGYGLQVACTDGAGGAFVAWDTAFPIAVMLTRITSAGTTSPGWPTGGLQVSTHGTDPMLASDGLGGVFVTWNNISPSPRQVFLQLVSGSGFVNYVTGGTQITDLPGSSVTAALTADGQGGVFIRWRQDIDDVTEQSRLTRITATGDPAPSWTPDGITLSLGNTCALAPDTTGGAYVAWAGLTDSPSISGTLFRRVMPGGWFPSTLDVPRPIRVQPALTITPRPARTSVRFTVTGGACSSAEVLDAQGRVVRSGISPGTWNLRDDSGRRVAPGLYFLRASTTTGNLTERFVVID
jgi:hypothetical protein